MNPDADEKKIRTIIESVPKPDIIAEVRFRLKLDWAGDPAVDGLILVRDSEDEDVTFNRARSYRDAVEQAVRDARIGYWPYFDLALESEQREMDDEIAREQTRLERRGKKVPAAV